MTSIVKNGFFTTLEKLKIKYNTNDLSIYYGEIYCEINNYYTHLDIDNDIRIYETDALSQAAKHKKFMEIITSMSESNNYYEAIHEWRQYTISYIDDVCICTTSIYNRYHIVNMLNDNQTIVGSVCIKKVPKCFFKDKIISLDKEIKSRDTKIKNYLKTESVNKFFDRFNKSYDTKINKILTDCTKGINDVITKSKKTLIMSGFNEGRSYYNIFINSPKTIVYCVEHYDTPPPLYKELYKLLL